MLCPISTHVELVELRLNLRGLQVLLFLRIGVILDGHLLVTGPTNRDRQLEISGDFAKFFSFGVGHDDPFVNEGVVNALVNGGKIELVVADKSIFEEALVHEFDLDLALS